MKMPCAPHLVSVIGLRDRPIGHRVNRRWRLRKGAVTGRPHQSVGLGKAKLREGSLRGSGGGGRELKQQKTGMGSRPRIPSEEQNRRHSQSPKP